jgi:hypothetical protein
VAKSSSSPKAKKSREEEFPLRCPHTGVVVTPVFSETTAMWRLEGAFNAGQWFEDKGEMLALYMKRNGVEHPAYPMPPKVTVIGVKTPFSVDVKAETAAEKAAVESINNRVDQMIR